MKNVKQQVNNLHVRTESDQPLPTPEEMAQALQKITQQHDELKEQMNLVLQVVQRIDDKTTHSRQDEKRMLDTQHESKSESKFIKEKVTALGSSIDFIEDKVAALKPAVEFIKKNTTQTWFARVSGTLLGFTIIGIMFFFFQETLKASVGGDEFFESITSVSKIKAAASFLKTTAHSFLNHTDLLWSAFPLWLKVRK